MNGINGAITNLLNVLSVSEGIGTYQKKNKMYEKDN